MEQIAKGDAEAAEAAAVELIDAMIGFTQRVLQQTIEPR